MKRLGTKIILAGLIVCFFCTNGLAGEKIIKMSTTTSTQASGLLDILLPELEKDTGIKVKVIAKGTGAAIRDGMDGNVDVIFVHAKAREEKFVQEGYGTQRYAVMHNDFIVLGPQKDPAAIKGKSIKEALHSLKGKQATFASRGDNSGTHKKELSLWKAAELQVPEKENWYVQTGQGMLTTINIAAERNGYTMTDRGTYIKYEDNLGGNPPLKILVEGDAVLLNQYSVIAVNPTHCPKVKNDLTIAFIKWITGPDAQQQIKDFKLLGKPLFTPNAKM